MITPIVKASSDKDNHTPQISAKLFDKLRDEHNGLYHFLVLWSIDKHLHDHHYETMFIHKPSMFYEVKQVKRIEASTITVQDAIKGNSFNL